ncbi:cytidine deaminase [Methylocella silvestris]|uniref:cytidine deaminase n=1 Tax=Methylocella silvestris TaxID=199596 RepID=UPI001FDFB531|nr:cytidine deaminase [Methylocella silvestris]
MDALFEAASVARQNAYAPYSRFKVAASIRTPSGSIYSGVNVESASFPVGTCAEAGAIAAMVLAGERQISEILIVGEGDALVTPCGACRQRIFEFAGGGDPRIHVAGPGGVRTSFSLHLLLPHAFGPDLMPP